MTTSVSGPTTSGAGSSSPSSSSSSRGNNNYGNISYEESRNAKSSEKQQHRSPVGAFGNMVRNKLPSLPSTFPKPPRTLHKHSSGGGSFDGGTASPKASPYDNYLVNIASKNSSGDNDRKSQIAPASRQNDSDNAAQRTEETGDGMEDTTRMLPPKEPQIVAAVATPQQPQQQQQQHDGMLGSLEEFRALAISPAAGAIALASIMTIWYWPSILKNQFPIQVVFAWIYLAYTVGSTNGRLTALAKEDDDDEEAVAVDHEESILGSHDALMGCSRSDSIPTRFSAVVVSSRDSVNEKCGSSKSGLRDGQSTMMQRISQNVGRHLGISSSRRTAPSAGARVRRGLDRLRVWTTLNLRNKPTPPEGGGHGEEMYASTLMQRLKRNPRLRRKTVLRRISIPSTSGVEEVTEVAEEAAAASSDTVNSCSDMGGINMEGATAESLLDEVIDPLFTLRGMDIFMTADAEYDMSSHPYLIKNGLRDVPTCIVNMVTQWGNILIYFEMPSWVQDWDKIEEHHDDPDDVKALKRLFNGDDNYKNARVNILPSVVAAPRPIRVLAPAKKELILHRSAIMPVSWRHRNAEVDSDGRKLCPSLECTIDLVGNRAIRGMAGLVKRYLIVMAVDVAVIIQKPNGQKEEEPEACLGLWRFDHVDVSNCPSMPARFDHHELQQHPDVIRASQLIDLSSEEMSEITMAADDYIKMSKA